jgi:hypothetical protein
MNNVTEQHGKAASRAKGPPGAGQPCATLVARAGAVSLPFGFPPEFDRPFCAVSPPSPHPLALLAEPDRAKEAQRRGDQHQWRLRGAVRARSPSRSTVSWPGSPRSPRALPCCPGLLQPAAACTGLHWAACNQPAKVVLLMQQCYRATCDS